jgi:hypothetical protein
MAKIGRLEDFPQDHGAAARRAWDELGALHPERVADDADVRLAAGGSALEVPFLGRTYRVEPKTRSIEVAGGATDPVKDILVLHYLATADGTPLAGEDIGFAQVPGAGVYLGNFRGRVVGRLVGQFGKEPEALARAAEGLGSQRMEYGDASVRVQVFPRVPVTLILHAGDEEFKADGQVVFDRMIGHYLPIEDIVVASAELVRDLARRKAEA